MGKQTQDTPKERDLFALTIIGQSLGDEGLSADLGEDGQIVWFTGPDGNPVELCLAFEIEGKTTGYLYLTTKQQKPFLGFQYKSPHL